MAHRILFFLLLIANMVPYLNAKSQQHSLSPVLSGRYCPDKIYYGIESVMKLTSYNRNEDLRYMSMISDSVSISKISDSLYTLIPLYEQACSYIYLINTQDNRRVDSFVVRSDTYPFMFSITHRRIADDIFTNAMIFEEMKTLYVRSRTPDCFDYTTICHLIAYDVTLERGDSIVLSTRLKGNEQISNSFKTALKENAKAGDVLFAKNIILEYTNKKCLRIANWGLYTVSAKRGVKIKSN
jgi:hypothetical protein